MILKEVFQKKFEYGGIKFDEKYIYFQENETTVCKANIDDFTLVEEYHFEGDFSFNPNRSLEIWHVYFSNDRH